MGWDCDTSLQGLAREAGTIATLVASVGKGMKASDDAGHTGKLIGRHCCCFGRNRTRIVNIAIGILIMIEMIDRLREEKLSSPI